MMRNSTGGTSSSSTRKSINNIASSNEEKNSAKKLVQARLPFKVIAPGSSPASEASIPKDIDGKKEGKTTRQSSQNDTKDARKRKLSYESEDDAKADEETDNNVSKENVEVVASATVKKKKIAGTSNNSEVDVVSLLDDEDNDDGNVKETITTKANTSIGSKLKTPKAAATSVKGKRKGAGTPQMTSSSAQKDKSGNNSKLQIKLPLSAGKRNKRRKSKANTSLNASCNDVSSVQNNSCVDSADDIEEVSKELNPQKRTKLDYDDVKEDETKENIVCLESDSASEEAALKNESDKSETKITENPKENIETKSEEEKTERKEVVETPEESIILDSDDDSEGDDDDADDETENNKSTKSANVSSDISDDPKSTRHNTTIESIKDAENGHVKNKTLTPKQKKLLEQRQKAREEKERKIQEEKKKKQQEKEEKELAKKREREEKEELKRKEREEKEEVKRKEREEKERKRVAEVEAKNEEKRKKNEAKEEEQRKKDEERKRKEMEKEEAELKKKKAAEAFTKFFVAKAPSQALQNIEDDDNTGDGTKALAFRPFQIKGDMKLAPVCRKILTDNAKCRLDSLLGFRKGNHTDVVDEDSDVEDVLRIKPLPKSKLYLSQLRSGEILPGKWRRPSTESKDDVVIIEDDLERVGEAIVEDTPAYIREQMRVKFYKFHDNRRPPYYGTWRKKSSVVNPRKPFAQDKKIFDYEVDSDDEWEEEEEPGESLENLSDEEKSEEDDYEVDNEWFVPHGHLSDEEMQNEDELGMGDANDREAQKAKLQILQQEFAQEMKKKTEKIKPRLIGCIWIEANGNQPSSCPKIIWDTMNTRAMLCTDPPILEEPEVEEPSSPSVPNAGNSERSSIKPVTVTDEMMKDLVRLLHGNNHSKNFLIKEYIAFVEKTEESVKNGECANPLKSVIREKIDSIAEWQVVDAVPPSVAQAAESTKKKKKNKKRLCWVVNKETLDKLDMPSLLLQNNWEYTLTPKLKLDKESTTTTEDKNETVDKSTTDDVSSSKADDTITDKDQVKVSKSQITKFTKVLTAEEKAKNLGKTTSSNALKNSPKDNKNLTENKAKSPTSSKEKKRVPLLMSVSRDQQISTTAKNKLISQFLRKSNKDSTDTTTSTSKTNRSSPPTVVDDDVVILD